MVIIRERYTNKRKEKGVILLISIEGEVKRKPKQNEEKISAVFKDGT